GLTVSNSTSFSTAFPSVLHYCQFTGGKQNGVRFLNTKKGWDIRNSTFNNNRTGIHMLNSHDNAVLSSTFDFSLSDRAYASGMNFIRISYSDNNLIGRSNVTKNYFNISSEVQSSDIFRHIFLDNGGMNNKILCNDFTGGNRG